MRLNTSINVFALAAVFIIGAFLVMVTVNRISIATDMSGALPANSPTNSDANRIFKHHPDADQIAIDIGSVQGDAEQLVAAAMMVEKRLQQSDLFAPAKNRLMQKDLANLADQVIHHLPVLFTTGELQREIAPLLTDEAIRRALTMSHAAGLQMDGSGQASFMAIDPLGLRHFVMARMAAMNPAPSATIHRGRFFSADRHHVLVLASLTGSGLNTTVANALDRFFQRLDQDLKNTIGNGVTLTPTGAFRATLDNASIIKHDVRWIILWTAVGIAVLLLATCSPPLAGLLALLPALAGMVMAGFVFSLIHDSISILVLGFGGVIASITVVHGIAYMGVVDSNDRTHASREIRSVGLPAALTAVGGFGVLASSGLAVFDQMGQFTALSIGFSFLFVHTVFPRLLVGGRPVTTSASRRYPRIVERLFSTGWPGLVLALLTAAVLAGFIRLHAATDLKPMRSASGATKSAEQLMTDVWGNLFPHFFLITRAADIAELQAKNDRLLEQLETEANAGRIERALTPSLFFPGRSRSMENGEAWNQFWTDERVRRVTSAVNREATALEIADGSFTPFLTMITAPARQQPAIPPSLEPLLSISQDKKDGRWHQATRITPRDRFESRRFYARVSETSTVFDPANHFRFPPVEDQLVGNFVIMLLMLGAGLVFLLVLFWADTGLLFTSLLPLGFALVCTLGTLGMMGLPPDIPALMLLAVVIPGAGAGYTLLMVRGYQRYQRFDHPHFSIIREAVLSGAGSTLLSAAVLLTANHSLLQCAGRVAICSIGYSLAGALLILPPLLKRRFKTTPVNTRGILWRYRMMEPYPRLSARCKLRRDPLFNELAALVPVEADAVNILDVGCGYGVPACWMADRFPGSTIHGIEPDPERVRIAALALGDRGRIVKGSAPHLPPMDVLLNLATVFDVSHFLQDWELEKTLERIHERLLPGGYLIMRSMLPPPASSHRIWRLKHLRRTISGFKACYRSEDALAAILDKCEFDILTSHASGRLKNRHWHVATPR